MTNFINASGYLMKTRGFVKFSNFAYSTCYIHKALSVNRCGKSNLSEEFTQSSKTRLLNCDYWSSLIPGFPRPEGELITLWGVQFLFQSSADFHWPLIILKRFTHPTKFSSSQGNLSLPKFTVCFVVDIRDYTTAQEGTWALPWLGIILHTRGEHEQLQLQFT